MRTALPLSCGNLFTTSYLLKACQISKLLMPQHLRFGSWFFQPFDFWLQNVWFLIFNHLILDYKRLILDFQTVWILIFKQFESWFSNHMNLDFQAKYRWNWFINQKLFNWLLSVLFFRLERKAECGRLTGRFSNDCYILLERRSKR